MNVPRYLFSTVSTIKRLPFETNTFAASMAGHWFGFFAVKSGSVKGNPRLIFTPKSGALALLPALALQI